MLTPYAYLVRFQTQQDNLGTGVFGTEYDEPRVLTQVMNRPVLFQSWTQSKTRASGSLSGSSYLIFYAW